MTREEAIQLIDEIASSYYPCDKKDALEWAIKALEPKPYEKFESAKDHIYKLAGDYKCWDNRLTKDEAVELCHILEQQPCEDAISRDDALKALDYDVKSFEFKSGVGKHMNEIANLLNTIYEIQSDNIKALPPVQPEYNTSEWCHDCSEYDHDKHCCPRYNGVIRKAVEEIKKPKVGYWIIRDDLATVRYYQCSECNEIGLDNSNYCPNCGARMVEPQESEES